jgi:hypothetical protein
MFILWPSPLAQASAATLAVLVGTHGVAHATQGDKDVPVQLTAIDAVTL